MKRPCGDECEEAGVMWQRPSNSDAYSMVLKMQMIDGTSFDVTVDPWTTIEAVKSKVNQLKGFSLASQSMSIRNVMCENHRQINMYTNTRNTVVDLVLSSSSSGSGGGESTAEAAPALADANGDDGEDSNSEAEANHALLTLLQNQRRAREDMVEGDAADDDGDEEQDESELARELDEILENDEDEDDDGQADSDDDPSDSNGNGTASNHALLGE